MEVQSQLEAALGAALLAIESVTLLGGDSALNALLEAGHPASILTPKNYSSLPIAVVRKSFEDMLDLARGELVLALQDKGIPLREISTRLNVGQHRLRTLRTMAQLHPSIKQIIRTNRIQESSLRGLINRPPHASLEELLRCVVKHRPSRMRIYTWIRKLKQYPQADIETLLEA